MSDTWYDVIVVGGGPAGLGAALTLARARRSVLVVDDGQPRNATSGHLHGYLGREAAAPGDLLESGRAEVTSYGGQVRPGRVTGLAGVLDDFLVTFSDGGSARGRRVLLATGQVDVLPDVPGLRARWGRDVLHCPYCHGWEVRDQRLGVLACVEAPTHQAQLFRQWSDRVTLFVQDADLSGHDRTALAARGIGVVEEPVVEVAVEEDRLVGARLASGRLVGLDALVVSPRMEARTGLAEAVGAQVDVSSLGRHLVVDEHNATTVPGVWSVGNAADATSVAIAAAAQGVQVAAAINADLVRREVADAVAGRPEQVA